MLRRLMLAVFLLCTSAAFGQIATGTYQFGEFQNHGLDTINVGNLNTHLTIPVVDKPGRGQSFYYNLAYDSAVWYPSSISGTKAWTTGGLFGWTGDTQAATGYLTYLNDSHYCSLDESDSDLHDNLLYELDLL